MVRRRARTEQEGIFDAAYRNIYELTISTPGNGSRWPFLPRGCRWAPSSPQRKSRPATPRKEVVDGWNRDALKDLTVGASTPFLQVGDLVIIEAAIKGGEQTHYVNWAETHEAVKGKVTMARKGKLFNAGSILAEGVRDRASFEAAIHRVSDKEVQYPAADTRLGQPPGLDQAPSGSGLNRPKLAWARSDPRGAPG